MPSNNKRSNCSDNDDDDDHSNEHDIPYLGGHGASPQQQHQRLGQQQHCGGSPKKKQALSQQQQYKYVAQIVPVVGRDDFDDDDDDDVDGGAIKHTLSSSSGFNSITSATVAGGTATHSAAAVGAVATIPVAAAAAVAASVLSDSAASNGLAANDLVVGDEEAANDTGDEVNNIPDDPHERTSKDYYFDSYSHHSIHEEMLKDEVRTKTYQMAILQNKHLFHDKIVLDVGCGTGILSMFAAQAGAKHVYAVDCSSILEQARIIVDRNGFRDKITLIRGKIEEIELPVDQVDIIVSEWMGYFLLYESMLDTVIFARDKWLVPNGVILPDKAVMYIAGVEDSLVKRERFDFWKDVYGFDMSVIKDIAINEPVVDVVDAKAIVTDSKPILHLDILRCKKEDLEFASQFSLTAQRNDFINGLVCYFEVAFTQLHKPIGFSTAPFARYTHWKQTIFYVEDAITICAGENVSGEISCKPNKRNRRDLDIGLALKFKGRFSQTDGNTIHFRLR